MLTGPQVNLPVCVSCCELHFCSPSVTPAWWEVLWSCQSGPVEAPERRLILFSFATYPAILNILTLYLVSHSHKQCPGFALLSVAPLLWAVRSSCLSFMLSPGSAFPRGRVLAVLLFCSKALLWNKAQAPRLHDKRHTWAGPRLLFQANIIIPL